MPHKDWFSFIYIFIAGYVLSWFLSIYLMVNAVVYADLVLKISVTFTMMVTCVDVEQSAALPILVISVVVQDYSYWTISYNWS